MKYIIKVICKNFTLSGDKFIELNDAYYILAATSKNIDLICAHIYYLSLINNNFILDNNYDYKTCYNNNINFLREVFCPKELHIKFNCKCPLYDE